MHRLSWSLAVSCFGVLQILQIAHGGEKLERMAIQQNCKDVLACYSAVLDKYAPHIPYFIADGTVLGWARTRSFVPWDSDMDVAYWAENALDLMTLFSSANITTVFDVEFASCRRIPKKGLYLFVGGSYSHKPGWQPGWMLSDDAIATAAQREIFFAAGTGFAARASHMYNIRFYSVFDPKDPGIDSRCYMDIDPYIKAELNGQPARYNTFLDHKRTILERDLIPAFPCRVEDVNTRCPANVSHMLTDVYGKVHTALPSPILLSHHIASPLIPR